MTFEKHFGNHNGCLDVEQRCYFVWMVGSPDERRGDAPIMHDERQGPTASEADRCDEGTKLWRGRGFRILRCLLELTMGLLRLPGSVGKPASKRE